MKKGTKVFLGIVAVLALVAVGWFIIDRVRKNRQNAATDGTGTGSAPSGSTPTGGSPKPNLPVLPTTKTPAYTALPDGAFPIKKGSKSKLVWLYQYYLNIMYGAGLTLDGSWGDNTEAVSVAYTGVSQIDLPKAEALLKSVPTAKIRYFSEYADLVSAKISVALGNAVKNS